MTESLYEKLIRPLLFRLDAEAAHNMVHCLLRSMPVSAGSRLFTYDQVDLELNLFGATVTNPVGLAAGFDKNGDLIERLAGLGFGFAEIGSVCARRHAGNPRPRLFRLVEDRAVINRMGLNGDGAERISARLRSAKWSLPVGLNLAKTNDPAVTGDAAVADVLETFSLLKDLPVLYFTVNASCPNTNEGCVTESRLLADLFAELQKANSRKVPLLVKLSPDSADDFLEELTAIAADKQLAGFVCGNTTVTREYLSAKPSAVQSIGAGGLSGAPLKPLNLALCQKIFARKQPHQSIIGVGGIFTGQDAFDYICAGACAVQLYTAMVYCGPSLVRNVCAELSGILRHRGHTLKEAVGCALSQAS